MKSKKDQTPDQKSDDMIKNLGLDQPQGNKKHFKSMLLIVVILIVASIAVASIWKREESKAKLVHYKTQEARVGDLTVIVEATGTLQPTDKVEVGSELSGTVKSVEADYNYMVKVGQVLARLDTEKLEEKIIQSKASLASAQAKVLQAQATVEETLSKLNRLKHLYQLSNQKVPSKDDLDAAEADLKRAQADEESSKAQVAEAKAELKSNQTDLSKAVIRSPINGMVLQRSVEVGQTVAASLQAPVLFLLAVDMTKMELDVDVDEADVGQVKAGQDATFTVEAFPDRKFPARITEVHYGAQTINGVVTYQAILLVDNPDLALRPGMTATADIVTNKIKDAFLVPNAALRFEPPSDEDKKPKGSSSLVSILLPRHPPQPSANNRKKESWADSHKRRIWILSEGKPVPVPVTIGQSDGQMTEVKAGEIHAGVPVIVDMEKGAGR